MQCILVAYDETEPSQRALARAVEIANLFGARLLITSVAPLLHSSPRTAGPVDPADSLQHHQDELRHAQAFAEERGLTPELLPAVGDPGDAIARIADERNVDLVVVGTREPGFLDRILHPSVSQEVARKVHHDVLIVHPEH